MPLNTQGGGISAVIGDPVDNYFLVAADHQGNNPLTGEKKNTFTIKEIELWEVDF